MNTTSPGVGLAALLGGQAAAEPAGAAAPASDDFTSALAAAAAPQLFAAANEDALEAPPEDMPSAAALAFLSGLLTAISQPGGAASSDGEALSGDALQANGTAAQRQAALLALLGNRPGQAGAAGLAADAGQVARKGIPMADLAELLPQNVDPEGSSDIDSLFSVLAGARGTETAVRPGADPASLSSLLSATLAATGSGKGLAPDPAAHAAVKHGVGSAGWADEVGSRLVMMSLRGQHEGSLTLSPEHLGPLEVRISVSQDRADVWFGAQHADTRAALADALPRLRELFAASGLSLGQTGVSQDMPRQDARALNPAATPDATDAAEVPALTAATPAAQTRGLALLDTWA